MTAKKKIIKGLTKDLVECKCGRLHPAEYDMCFDCFVKVKDKKKNGS